MLEVVGLLSVAEARQIGRPARVRDLHSHGRLALGPGFAQDGKRGQRFVVDFCDEKGIARVVLLPNLADLYLLDGHLTNVDSFPRGVNNASPG